MIGRMISGAIKGARASLVAGQSGWEVSLGQQSSLGGAGQKSNAGPRVSPETMMQLSAVFACASVTSQVASTIPGALYAKGKDDTRVRVQDELAEILTVSPNSEQTAVEFWEGMIAQQLLRGNAVAQRLTIGNRLVGFKPLPNCVPRRNREGVIEYPFSDRGKTELLPADKVFHMRGFGAGDGLGLSAVRYGVHSFGAALAADQTASAVFGNGMMPNGFIQTSGVLTPEQRAQWKSTIDSFTGSTRAGRTMLLEGGFTYQPGHINPEDAQLLETRRFSVEDICRWFGVPPIIIGHAADGQTMWGTGVEAIMLSWLTKGINPMLRKIEARILKDLIPLQRRREWYFEFNREAILQMDSKSKGEFMSKMGASGTMTANERRARLNLPRSDDPNADRLLAQTALAPLGDLAGNTK